MVSRVLGVFLLVACIFSPARTEQVQASSQWSIPFHTSNSMILIEIKVNGRPATMLFDTGARRTLLSAKLLAADLPLEPMLHRSYDRGLEGQIIEKRVNMLLADQEFPADVMVGNLDQLGATMGVGKCDGLLGQDVLERFRSFTVSRKSRTIDFER